MIQKIQKSKLFKTTCVFLALNIFAQIVSPSAALALTGGPKQPEFNKFTPIGVSDMVDLSSGDMKYNIPLMDVGGYPINIAYSSETSMDKEASWVGLNWDLNVGQINRNVRGIPDDFKGDEIQYENYMKPNVTVGADFKVEPNLFGVSPVSLSAGVSIVYNNYTGMTMTPSVGASLSLGQVASVGFNISSNEDGMTISPNASIHQKMSKGKGGNNSMGLSVGTSMNSRQGLTSASLSMTNSNAQGRFTKTKEDDHSTSGSIGSSIGFVNTSYTPTKRVGMNTEAFTVNVAGGSEINGVEVQGQITAYGTIQSIWDREKNKKLSSFGYEHTQEATISDVLDFNKEKDGALTKMSKNVPLTNYTYDIYSVQGQGVSGMYRPFRNQVGYVYDPFVSDVSTSGSLGFEVGLGNLVHAGVDFEVTQVNSSSSCWTNLNQMLPQLKSASNIEDDRNSLFEMVHFKNVGDLSVDEEFEGNNDVSQNIFENTGSYRPIRIPFVGRKYYRSLQDYFLKKGELQSVNGKLSDIIDINKTHYKDGGLDDNAKAPYKRTVRQRRNQSINNVTYGELTNDGIGYGPLKNSTHPHAKNHHTAEVQITRNDGARYIYGYPLYNITKRETTFAVNGSSANRSTGIVNKSFSSVDDLPNDKFFERTTTPGYAHTYLLTDVLSTDYRDVKNDGPTVDDYGSYTHFNYSEVSSNYKWRVPLVGASYNEGLNTNPEDDRGNYVYGEKQIKLINEIVTKTHVAVFETSERKDALGVLGEAGGVDPNQKSHKLDKISLYSITDYYLKNGDVNNDAVPIKEVHFEYSYSLCGGVENNLGGVSNELSNKGGKLTLKKIYFTYRDSKMGKYTGYKFNYNEYEGGHDEYDSSIEDLVLNNGNNRENPSYNLKGYDSWGNYLPNDNYDPSKPTSAEFPFTSQDITTQDTRAAVWNLKKIELPSGGIITVDYESDDYSHVQDKEVMGMYKISGFGDDYSSATFDPLSLKNTMYENNSGHTPYKFMYVKVDDRSTDAKDYFNDNDAQMYFRVFTNMTSKGGGSVLSDLSEFDFVTGYLSSPTVDEIISVEGGNKYLKIELPDATRGDKNDHAVNPITKAGWNFARKFLPKFAYSLSDEGDRDDIEAIAKKIVQVQTFNNMMDIFNGPNFTLEKKLIARTIAPEKSWIRLRKPDVYKLGGGARVKTVQISDVWSSMTESNGYQTMNYGQRYWYTSDGKDPQNGGNRTNTSGVASYEPVGNKENPFVQPVFTTEKHLLSPDDDNYAEMPFGESFFPNPQVTYAKVTVANIQAGIDANTDDNKRVKKLHRTGKVVNEFYTTRDFPTIVDQTIIQAKEDDDLLGQLLNLKSKKGFTASQGYVIHLNDMNGKQKGQWVYAEGQEAPISGVEYKYSTKSVVDNTDENRTFNSGKLNNIIPVINSRGYVSEKKIGVEVDIVNSFNQSSSVTTSQGMNTNLATFLAGIIPIPVPMPLPDFSSSEDFVRIASTTKVINTFGLLEETIAYSNGSAVSTKNLAWDEATGEVLLTQTVDEFDEKYYTLNYPAHWYYKGMGQASQNLGFKGTFNTTSTVGGETTHGINGFSDLTQFLIEGDELIYEKDGEKFKAWVNKIPVESVGVSVCTLIDVDGFDIVDQDINFEVIRSGHDNLQSAGIMNITLMENPIRNNQGQLRDLDGNSFNEVESTSSTWRIINAGAVLYSDNWPLMCECGVTNPGAIRNPYTHNEKGVWRTESSRTYLAGRTASVKPTPKKDGFFSHFKPMYEFGLNGLNINNIPNWTFVSEVSKFSPYGFETENKDALDRHSAAQYGYNNKLPMAVGANLEYKEIGFDGFEDYKLNPYPYRTHFKFDVEVEGSSAEGGNKVSKRESHTGMYSVRVSPGSTVSMKKKLVCVDSDDVVDDTPPGGNTGVILDDLKKELEELQRVQEEGLVATQTSGMAELEASQLNEIQELLKLQKLEREQLIVGQQQELELVQQEQELALLQEEHLVQLAFQEESQLVQRQALEEQQQLQHFELEQVYLQQLEEQRILHQMELEQLILAYQQQHQQ